MNPVALACNRLQYVSPYSVRIPAMRTILNGAYPRFSEVTALGRCSVMLCQCSSAAIADSADVEAPSQLCLFLHARDPGQVGRTWLTSMLDLRLVYSSHAGATPLTWMTPVVDGATPEALEW